MRGGLLAGMAVIALLVAGCGQQPGGTVLDSSIAASSSSAASAGSSPGTLPGTSPGAAANTPPASSQPTSAAGGGCASARLTISNADNGKTVCVRPGTALLVLLRDGAGPIRYSGPLTPRPDGRLMLMRGETGAAFTAGRAGVATITSVISPCASEPGPMHCLVLMLFRARVEIRAS
jgi:hypothetical protein